MYRTRSMQSIDPEAKVYIVKQQGTNQVLARPVGSGAVYVAFTSPEAAGASGEPRRVFGDYYTAERIVANLGVWVLEVDGTLCYVAQEPTNANPRVSLQGESR